MLGVDDQYIARQPSVKTSRSSAELSCVSSTIDSSSTLVGSRQRCRRARGRGSRAWPRRACRTGRRWSASAGCTPRSRGASRVPSAGRSHVARDARERGVEARRRAALGSRARHRPLGELAAAGVAGRLQRDAGESCVQVLFGGQASPGAAAVGASTPGRSSSSRPGATRRGVACGTGAHALASGTQVRSMSSHGLLRSMQASVRTMSMATVWPGSTPARTLRSIAGSARASADV